LSVPKILNTKKINKGYIGSLSGKLYELDSPSQFFATIVYFPDSKTPLKSTKLKK
jgi:hypothetical protein